MLHHEPSPRHADASSSAAWQASRLPGVAIGNLRLNADERGSFTELWRAHWTHEFGVEVRQANLSRSEPGVLRGLHFHERQADLWTLVDGRAFVALVDLRPRLADPKATAAVLAFEMAPGTSVFIPAGVAHGFLALERVTLLYMVTNEYDGTDEHGFAWNDPDAAIDWPTDSPILSGRDSSNPRLDEAVESMRQRGTLNPT